MTSTTMSASSLAGVLKRLGFPTSHVRTREGIRVKGRGSTGRVTVAADFDLDSKAIEVAEQIEEALREKGYIVERKPDAWIMHVSKPDA